MKKTISMVSNFIKMMTRPAANKSERMIFVENLPMIVKIFVATCFPNKSIAFAGIMTTSKGVMYTITLNDGTQVGFNENGSCVLVDCGMEAVPAGLIPTSVEAFVSFFHPNLFITKIEKCANGHEVALSNHVTLKVNDLKEVA
ncbi:MAG: PepSY-like domain-containing protein [Prevotella sp.]|nr:PepSY-like domain-containing protein [Prevotella sp.]